MVQVQPKQAKYKYTRDVCTPCCRQTYKQTFMWRGVSLECLSFPRMRFRFTENLEPGMARVRGIQMSRCRKYSACEQNTLEGVTLVLNRQLD
jgi:hypothetical protein